MSKIYALTKEQFNELPEEVQKEVLDTLKAYNECPVIYENGRYHYVSIISSYYAPDHKFIGIAYQDDFYTEDEQILNYMESFHDYHPRYKGAKDWKMLQEVGYDWDVKFKFDERHNIVRA